MCVANEEKSTIRNATKCLKKEKIHFKSWTLILLRFKNGDTTQQC